MSFLAETLEACPELVENKLPEQERTLLLGLIEAAKTPLLSRDAVLALHQFTKDFRHLQELEGFVTPLSILQVCC